jgi:uncharacterized protein involved in exopolysaccharide biosynthesis
VGVLVEALKEYISSNEADKDLMKARIAELEKRNNDLIRRLEKLENEKKK